MGVTSECELMEEVDKKETGIYVVFNDFFLPAKILKEKKVKAKTLKAKAKIVKAKIVKAQTH